MYFSLLAFTTQYHSDFTNPFLTIQNSVLYFCTEHGNDTDWHHLINAEI